MAFWSKKASAQVEPEQPAVNGQSGPASVAHQAKPDAAQSKPASTAPQPTHLSADEMAQRAADAKKRLALFGEIVAIFMRSPQFRAMSVAELEGLIIPALNNNQFFVVESQSKENGILAPVSAALWATVSAEVDRRLSSNLDQPITLAPAEWKSGDIAWLIAAAGDNRVLTPMLRQISETALKGAPVKFRTRDKNGQVAVTTFSPAAS
jgi:cytolysin-activating lysine-acyltransferase